MPAPETPRLGRTRTQRVVYTDDGTPTQKPRHPKKDSVKISPPKKKAKYSVPGKVPACVSEGTVLASATQIASILEGLACRVANCQGRRSIEAFQTAGSRRSVSAVTGWAVEMINAAIPLNWLEDEASNARYIRPSLPSRDGVGAQ